MFWKSFAKLEKITCLIIFFSILGAIYSLQKKHLIKSQTQIPTENYAQQIELAKVTLQTQQLIPTFGFSNLRADLTYLQFVQYFGDREAREDTGYALVPDYFATVANYDPNFTQANLSFSVANSIYAGQPEQTVTLMAQVIESSNSDLDDTYLIWFTKGLDEFLFLGDNQAALNSHQNSAQLAIKQDKNNLNQIIAANQSRIEYLATDPDTREAQIIAWKTVLPYVVEPHNRQRISDRITSLEQSLSYQAKKQ